MVGGYVEAMIRADSEAAWEAAAEARFLLVRDEETDTLHPAPHVHIDGPMFPIVTERAPAESAPESGTASIDGDVLTIDDGSEFLSVVTKRGDQAWLVAEGGAVVEGDKLAEEIPAVLDTRPHYNLRIAPWVQEALAEDGVTPRWYETLVMFHTGEPITESDRNKAEDGLYVSGITVLDPETINSAERHYL